MLQSYLRMRVADMDGEKLLKSRREFLDHLRNGRFQEAKVELSAHLERAGKQLWNSENSN